MTKKQKLMQGLQDLALNAIKDIDSMPAKILDAINEYEAQATASDGSIKLKLVVTFIQEETH